MVARPQQPAAQLKPGPNVAALRAALAAGDARAALRLAAKFPHLGPQKAAIMRGWEACARPAFYRQLGHDPEALVRSGVAALKERYGAE